MGIEDTIVDKGKTYGEFEKNAALSQLLKAAMFQGKSWTKLSVAQKEALELLQLKVSRILNGDPLYLDSWKDLVGYSTLGELETRRLIDLASLEAYGQKELKDAKQQLSQTTPNKFPQVPLSALKK